MTEFNLGGAALKPIRYDYLTSVTYSHYRVTTYIYKGKCFSARMLRECREKRHTVMPFLSAPPSTTWTFAPFVFSCYFCFSHVFYSFSPTFNSSCRKALIELRFFSHFTSRENDIRVGVFAHSRERIELGYFFLILEAGKRH